MSILKNIILILLLFQFNNKLLSQVVKEIDGFAFNPKIGPSFDADNGNEQPVIGLEVNVLKNNFIYSLGYLGHNKLGALILNGPSQNQFGIILGKYIGEKHFRVQYQAGINLFWGSYSNSSGSSPWINGSNSSSPFFTVGAESKIGFKYIPLKNLSIGIDFQVNLNYVKTLYMPMFSLEIGKLKNENIKFDTVQNKAYEYLEGN